MSFIFFLIALRLILVRGSCAWTLHSSSRQPREVCSLYSSKTSSSSSTSHPIHLNCPEIRKKKSQIFYIKFRKHFFQCSIVVQTLQELTSIEFCQLMINWLNILKTIFFKFWNDANRASTAHNRRPFQIVSVLNYSREALMIENWKQSNLFSKRRTVEKLNKTWGAIT